MLNDIRLHLDSDESLQRAHELALTRTIDALKEANTQAFEKYIPSIGKILPQLPFERLSIFADKDSQSNIVDFNTGRTLYARHPDKHIKEQVASWHYHSALLDLSEQNELDALNSNIKSTLNHTDISFEQSQHQAKQLYQALLAKGADTLVMLGLGKALQLDYLFDETSNQHFPHKGIKHLVIYEPDWEIFRCSLSVFNWSAFLENAASVGLQIYMQIGSDLSQLDKEIDELRDAYGAKRILFYQHLNLPMYSAIIDRIRNNSWGKGSAQIKQLSSHQQHFLHVFSAIDSNNWTSANRQTPLFVKNMALFKEYYPEIHDAYEAYQGQIWETITHKHSGQINLFNKAYKTYFSSSEPLQEAQALSQHFNQYPNLDGLVFGHSGDKLKHYAHNTFIRQTDVVLRQTQEQSGQLPKEVKCLLVFGLGTGYQLAHLAKQNNIHNLVICEPNPDMFYASLHAIDWAPIFNAIEESDCQLYINIGEASSVLFKDLMSQFLQIGPHVLNETYIMQAYHNPMLDQVLTEVRQQLKVIFSMVENFDHVAYGIAHTAKALEDKVPALRYQPSQYLSYQHKQMPIFLVGNGPSLDDSIDILKEHRDSVIVVSCGTALQALYKNGITPDFHGEVEQNRANYDWASRINDKAYLKQITLLSVNGIHPDTYGLYKNVLFAFKSGESSTQATLATLPKDSFHCLGHAYPTVTNMAMSFFLALGFEQLYLVGVDLGFIDQDKHHSSASGYYENGKQIYDYKAVHAADLRVKGNRCEWVFTKTEFNISRMIIEQLLREPKAQGGGRVECFNLSNGVLIDGTIPLLPESVLIMSSAQEKQNVMSALDNCFMSLTSNIYSLLQQAYKRDLLVTQIEQLSALTNEDIHSKVDITELIDALSDLLNQARRQGHSLFFYYFFNSINFLSAALNKASLQSDEQKAVKDCQHILQFWRVFLVDAQRLALTKRELLDSSEAYSEKREHFLLEQSDVIAYMSLCKNAVSFLKTEITKNESALQLIDSIDGFDGKIVIDIQSQDHINTIVHMIEQSKRYQKAEQSHVNIAMAFNDYESMLLFSNKHQVLCQRLCLIYIPPCIALLENKELAKNGERDALTAAQYLHVIQSRAQDLRQFSSIIVKPRFSKLGLKNAITSSNDEISSQGPIDNEYESIAANYIDKHIASKLAVHKCYMFKHYVAYCLLDRGDESMALTIVDNLENRGMLFERPLFAHELLGQWQDELIN